MCILSWLLTNAWLYIRGAHGWCLEFVPDFLLTIVNMPVDITTKPAVDHVSTHVAQAIQPPFVSLTIRDVYSVSTPSVKDIPNASSPTWSMGNSSPILTDEPKDPIILKDEGNKGDFAGDQITSGGLTTQPSFFASLVQRFP